MKIIKESKDNKVKIRDLQERDTTLYNGYICMIIDNGGPLGVKYDDKCLIVDLTSGKTEALLYYDLVEKIKNAKSIY